MKKYLLVFFVLISISHLTYSQVMVTKLIGKNSKNSNIGFGVFTFFDFPLANSNNSFRIELIDFGYYSRKSDSIDNPIGYLSIKLGYKYMFSETPTGFYIEPAAGYCRVVSSTDKDPSKKGYGDGVALALEGGYSVEVGQRGNTVNFGLKYESDIAGTDYTANSIGFRVSFSFHIFGRRDE
jgi:hypothetical protein